MKLYSAKKQYSLPSSIHKYCIKGFIFMFFTLFLATMLSCKQSNTVRSPAKDATVEWAGLRSSTYGIKPFPSNDEWESYVQEMETFYPGSVGTFVWIVGYVTGNGKNRTCTLNFPLDTSIDGVVTFPIDENEEFLTQCDAKGYAVWLQVEPGNCDIASLAEAVMKRYAHHPSVRGFGIDVEWYYPHNTDGYGIPITDELAQQIDTGIKKIDKRFNFFLKHWDATWMPPHYRSDIIFVNDSQGHFSLSSMKQEFDSWAKAFYPNTIMYQIGYESDKDLWKVYEKPPLDLGTYLLTDLPAKQEAGIIWVDFTLRSVFTTP